eukprot:3182979-Heterocapsa_arctica.AAC.1
MASVLGRGKNANVKSWRRNACVAWERRFARLQETRRCLKRALLVSAFRKANAGGSSIGWDYGLYRHIVLTCQMRYVDVNQHNQMGKEARRSLELSFA